MSEQTTAEVVPEWDMSDRLRKALTHAGISSNEMAEYLEVTRHTISNWINGRTRPPATAVKLWAMRCGVPYEWLVGGEVSEAKSGHKLLSLRDDLAEDDRPPSTDEILSFRTQLHGSPKRPNRRIEAARS